MDARKLLKEAREVLSNHWFHHDGEEQDNNDDVVAMDQKIQEFLKTPAINPMTSAPKDGTRILLKYTVMHYRDYEWQPDGEKWEEAFWDATYEYHTSFLKRIQGAWKPWCGNPHVHSTETFHHPLGWIPLPEAV